MTPRYDHVQRGLIWMVLPVLALVVGTMAFALPLAEGTWVLGGLAVLLLLLSASMGWLRVRVESDALFVGYGPLPLFRRRIPWSRITGVEVKKAPAIVGIGLRWWPGFGWLWSVDAGDCVRLELRDGQFHVGTDDAERLAAVVRERIEER